MKQDKLSLASGFLPPVCMACLIGFSILFTGQEKTMLAAPLEIVAFLVPYLLIVLFAKGFHQDISLRLKGFTRKAFPFVIFLATFVSLASFLLNYFAADLFGLEFYQPQTISGNGGAFLSFLTVALLPAICEELFFRSGMLGAFDSRGTYAAIVVSAVSFALVHGNVANLIGPLVAGLVYGYLAYALGSVWPAVIAHLIHNTYFLLMGYMVKVYEALNLWPYFLTINILLLCLFLYLSMRSLEKLIERGKIARFHKAGLVEATTAILFSPGLWLLILLFIFKVIYL